MIELMLNQPRVIALLYEKTFSMTGLEANQQAENDVQEYSKRQDHQDYGNKDDAEESEIEFTLSGSCCSTSSSTDANEWIKMSMLKLRCFFKR